MTFIATPNSPPSDSPDADALGARRRLLARKLQQQRALPTRPTTADPIDGVALSFSQEALWFLDQLTGGSSAYNISSVTRLQGSLDVAALERSLRALLARHASLRTAFRATEQGPVQQVMPASEAAEHFCFTRTPLAPGEATEGALAQRIVGSIAQPFDLSQAPLLRAELFQLSPEHCVLVLVMHHIVTDGWSLTIIHRELAQLYAAGGNALGLAGPALQFPGCAVWQRQRFERGGLQTQLDYWRTNLRDLQTLELPTDKPRPSQAGSVGRTLAFRIEGEFIAPLRSFAQQQGATLFMTLLAAFQALLMRYSGQTDIAVGVPVARRTDAAFNDVVGYFANATIMRGDLEGQPGFIELLQRVRKVALGALSHQDVPFDRLVAELRPERDASRSPLYQVWFALEHFPDRVLALAGLKSERLGIHSETSKFDLSLTLLDAGDHLDAEFEYRTDLFEAETIARMAEHFSHLLAGIMADPNCAVTRLPLLGAAEQRRLLVEWNDHSHPYPHEQPVQALFSAQARQTPEAIALRFGPHGMTYRELDILSEQLAHQLRDRGVGPEVVVGLCMQRCFGLVVGLLAILKAGGAFLPLDPDYPPERLQAMLADAAPAWVLTQTRFVVLLRQLDATAASGIVEVPDHGGDLPREPVPPVTDLTRPEQLAYLIYTSGSTGKPKAAQLMHRGLSNHILWLNDVLELTARDRVLQKTSISFDASIWEFFSPLIGGAQLVLAQPDAQRDMALLAETLCEDDISVIQFVPSALRVMLDELESRPCPSLRYVVSGGEALDRALALAFKRVLPHVKLGNFYGPSEASDDSAWYEIGAQPPDRPIVPIGRPVANGQLYVLDAYLQPQPIGVAGELYVGGLGVGRGYRNRPELTAERFVPNPFRPGERMYRTGDLARWLNGGLVEFIGRNDHQVKLRGFRIELGEIEAALNACSGVQMCAVMLREDVPGRKQLVAYVVADGPGDLEALRSALKAGLPDYMVPAAFVLLPELPRLPNGKLDRKTLPAPEIEASESARVAPRSALESTLLEIWQGVLGANAIGIHDSFFDLGGHSLIATQIVSRIRSTFQVELPLRSLFEHPTIGELAGVVEPLLTGPSARSAAALDPIVAVGRGEPLPVSFSQRHMWLLHQMDPSGAAYNMRQALRLRGPLAQAALRMALDQLVARHEAFRTTFALGTSEPLAIVGAAQPANLIELDLRSCAETCRDAELGRQAAQMAAEPFDLASGPLHRFILVRLGAQDHALVLVMHHIIGDDWSWGILLRELQSLYQAHLHGRAASLPPPAGAIDFVDYAVWQRRYIDGDVLATQTRYWLQQLGGMSPLNLPNDTAVVQRITSRGGRVRQNYADDWFKGVQRFSAHQGLSPFMTLLAAFQVLLARYCGQEDVAVGTPVAGRTRVEAEQVVGSLVSTLVLRSSVHPAQTFRELLHQVRETCLSAFTHQDVPYDYLIEHLRAQSPDGKFNEVRAMFNVVNTPRQPLRLEGLDVSFIPLSLGATQFDLDLTIDTENQHALFLHYSTELFASTTAQRMLDHYLHLLDRLMQDPDRRLQDHTLTSPDDLVRIGSWNQTDRPYPHDTTVHALLATQRAVSGTALRQIPGASLSYPDLWAHAYRLAHVLRGRGVQRGCLVGLCVERDPAMVVAQLAILSAGAAYVPLDPAYPKQRLHGMAQDAGLTLLLTQQNLAELWQGLDLPMLLLDQADIELSAQPETPLQPDAERDARAEDPAYVIYTSGSTGKPKGVGVPHRAVVNFLLSMQREPGLGAHDALLAVTTLSFDIAVLELLLPLSVGATIVLARHEQAIDGVALRSLLELSRATVMQATPVSWRMLIDAGWAGSPAFKALIGGESLSLDLAQALLARSGELWNLYGPTETTVWSTCWKVPPEGLQIISIGRPIANTQIHVLDVQGRQCPIGVAGEIFIGGHGVALGYLHRPELTAERFVVDPFSPNPDARLYKTGDRGRWRHDGLLEHQGRLDFQVKVRGHRIEPGEIEAQLQTHPAVAQCLVMAREDHPGDTRLVAYVVARGAMPDARALKDHLRTALPEYMLPQHVVALEALPLLPNGKINRHPLPAPASEPRANHDSTDAPRTPAEIALAQAWSDVLGFDTIGRYDNFFDLGGDSLQATRAVMAFQRDSGTRLEARRVVFETLAQLAGGIELRAADLPQAAVIPAEVAKASWLHRLTRRWRAAAPSEP